MGKVDIATAVGVDHVVADVVGYYDDGTGGGDLFNPIVPVRLLDSRTSNGGWNGRCEAGAPQRPGRPQPANPAGVPVSATAWSLNVTVTGGNDQSFVSAWPRVRRNRTCRT